MVTDEEPAMFDAPDPVPAVDRFAGLGNDAARTLRQHDMLAAGVHPATRMPLQASAPPMDDRNAPGPRCGSCSKRYFKTNGNGGWWKCGLTKSQANDGPDLRQWWPACNLYVEGPEAMW